MSFRIRRKNRDEVDIWPGFVDALSTVLLVFIFVLVGFISSQVYLSGLLFDKDSSLKDLQCRLSSICSLLDDEKERSTTLENLNADLTKQINDLKLTVSSLEAMFSKEEELRKSEHEAKVSLEEKIDNLTKQLKEVLAALTSEREISEERKKEIENIKKENLKLNEISKFNSYRSEFFDKLQNIVKDKKGIKIVGDRFIFQSELFFDTASDILSEEGEKQVKDLAEVVKDI